MGACTSLIGVQSSVRSPIISPPANSVFWSNYNWTIKIGTGLGPGPNSWSASSVRVAGETLTLSIAKNPAGVWNCGEIYLSKSLGYGNYSWQITSSPSSFDPDIVLGLFTYASDIAEIDAEFSRWGNVSAAANNADFAVQPAAQHGNLLDYAIPAGVSSCQVSFVWSPGKVVFSAVSLSGVRPWSRSWTCTTASVPFPGKEAVHINLWLFRGIAPGNGAGASVSLSNFSFSPLPS